VIETLKRLAIEAFPQEACAFICGEDVLPVENKHYNPLEEFEVDPEEFDRIEAEWGPITGFFHSHPGGPDCPSGADMQAQVTLGVPFWICSTDGEWASHPFSWGGEDRPPLVGRQFRHGVTDCYSLIRDYYLLERGIDLPEYPRSWEWWQNGGNLYLENLTKGPWDKVDAAEVQAGDLAIFKIGKALSPNHGGVYLGGPRGLMLHHTAGGESHDPSRLSKREPVSRWMNYLVGWYRYRGG